MLLLVTASLSLASEKPSPGTSNLANAAHPSLRIYDDRDGLPQNTAKSIAIDREGYLWVGTQDGAAYYNGRVWRTVNMPTRTASNWVTTICTASDGSILFGTNGAGICVLRHGDWTVLDRSNSPFNDGFIYQILESTPVTSPPTFWIAGGAGLFRLEGDRVLSADAPAGTLHGDVSAVLETVDPQGTRELWVGDDNGLVRRRNGSWESFIGSSGYPGTGTYCLSAGIDERGARVVWAGTMAGVARFASDRWTTVGTDPSESEPGVTHIFSIVTTHDPEILWVGSPAGLFHYEDGHWRKDSIATGLPDNSVVSLLELPAELGVRAVLAGTLSGGLVRLSLDGWRSVTDKSGLPDNHVYAFLEDTSSSGEAMFVGTYGGLARVAGDGTTVFRVGSGLPEDRVNCLLRTEDAVCVGTFGGIAILRNGAWSVVDSRSGLPDDGVRSLLETTSSGGAPILWAGTDRGLARRENGRWTVVDMSNGLPNNQVMALARTTARDGTESVWAGTLGGGLARLTGGHWTIVDATSGLPNDMVRCIREIDADGTRTLWVGTLGGAATLDLDDESAGWHIVADTTVPTLPNNVIYDVQADRQGRVYLLTNKGVARLTRRAPTAGDPSPFDLYNFTTEDGLPSNECNGGAALVDRNGRIWIGTAGGAAVLDPSKERSVPASPLRVERTLVNGNALATSGDTHAQPSWPSIAGTRLPYNRSDVVFESALLSYYKESGTTYRSQLVGLEDIPTAWATEPSRTFSRLPAGDYTFRVWARNASGAVSGPVEVAFSVARAPWRTWWAYALYALVLVGVVYLSGRLRLRTYERRTRLLEAKVADRTHELDAKNHELADAVARALDSEHAATEANRAKSVFLASMSHELRTPLNAVLGFVQLMQRTTRSGDRDREYLRVITRSGEHLLSLINDVLSISKIESGKIEVSPAAFPLAETLRGVIDVLASRASAKGLSLILDTASELPRFVFGDDGKLRQILINLVGNAVKFTTAGSVTLRASWHDGRAVFEVADTGPGIAADEIEGIFDPFVQTASGRASAEGTGLGLTITRSFVEMMGGEIHVESRTNAVGDLGSGTTFRFEIDLPETDAPKARDERHAVRLADGERAYRVLIADDKWENRLLLVDLLGPMGFEPREVADGTAAIEAYDAWRPDIVLMDVRMPMMDGCSATREIRRRQLANGAEHVVVIALSASVFAQDRQAILDAGCDEFLPKPIRTAELLDCIARLAGVRFDYAGASTDLESTPAASDGARHVSTVLEMVPLPLLERLRAAVDAGAVADAESIVAEIAVIEPNAGQPLASLLKSYRLDDLASAIDHATSTRREHEERGS